MIRTLTTILQEKGKMPRTDNTIFSLTLNGFFSAVGILIIDMAKKGKSKSKFRIYIRIILMGTIFLFRSISNILLATQHSRKSTTSYSIKIEILVIIRPKHYIDKLKLLIQLKHKPIYSTYSRGQKT